MNKVKVAYEKAQIKSFGLESDNPHREVILGKEVAKNRFYNEEWDIFSIFVEDEGFYRSLELDKKLPKAAKRILMDAFEKVVEQDLNHDTFIPVKGYDVFYNGDWIIYPRFLPGLECIRVDRIRDSFIYINTTEEEIVIEGNVYPPVSKEEMKLENKYRYLFFTDLLNFCATTDNEYVVVTPEGLGVRYPL